MSADEKQRSSSVARKPILLTRKKSVPSGWSEPPDAPDMQQDRVRMPLAQNQSTNLASIPEHRAAPPQAIAKPGLPVSTSPRLKGVHKPAATIKGKRNLGERKPVIDARPQMGVGKAAPKRRARVGDISLAEVRSKAEQLSAGKNLSSLTLPEMKCLLKASGRPVGGKKAELLARLQESMGARCLG